MKKSILLVIPLTIALTVGAFAQTNEKAKQPKSKQAQMDCCLVEKAAKAGDDCCKDMDGKTAMKGDPCESPNALAKFKVFVVGKGYAYYGCQDMAAKGRSALLAKGEFVGSVQKVGAKVKIASGVKA